MVKPLEKEGPTKLNATVKSRDNSTITNLNPYERRGKDVVIQVYTHYANTKSCGTHTTQGGRRCHGNDTPTNTATGYAHTTGRRHHS